MKRWRRRQRFDRLRARSDDMKPQHGMADNVGERGRSKAHMTNGRRRHLRRRTAPYSPNCSFAVSSDLLRRSRRPSPPCGSSFRLRPLRRAASAHGRSIRPIWIVEAGRPSLASHRSLKSSRYGWLEEGRPSLDGDCALEKSRTWKQEDLAWLATVPSRKAWPNS